MGNEKNEYNNYVTENISHSVNENLSNNVNVSPKLNLPDQIFHSAGLYSKSEVKKAKFEKFSRFGRVLDPYGRVNPGREFLFFVKPDLHICCPSNVHDAKTGVYAISDGEVLKMTNGKILNPQLTGNLYFKNLIETHPDVVDELQYSSTSDNDPFSHLLSFSVNSSLQLDSSTATTMDNPSTIFGTTYNYLKDSEDSDNAQTFSLEFLDDKELNTYHFFKAYSEYHIARKSGLVTPPTLDYYKHKRLHNTMGIYKFIVAEDMETIIYWAYMWGVIPTSCPREAFSDASFPEGLTFSVNFEAAFIEDMNPVILYTFNKLMRQKHPAVNIDNWIPIVRHNRTGRDAVSGDMLFNKNHSYDKSIALGDIKIDDKNKISATATEFIDGTLPSYALVDGRVIKGETPKYRLRWYE